MYTRASDVQGWLDAMRQKEHKERVKVSKELYQIYKHDWGDQLERELEACFAPDTWEEIKLRKTTAYNPLRFAADELAKIYAKSPVRSIDGIEQADGEDDPLDPYTADGLLDLALDEAARVLFACREIAIRPLVPDADKGKKHAARAITIDVVPPHKLYVEHDHTDLTKVQLVVICKPDGGYSAWDDEENVVTDAHGTITKRESNPYKAIPYIVAHAKYPTIDFWQTSDAYSLRDATYMVGIARTGHNYLRHMQQHLQGWYKSDDKVPLNVLLGPGNWLHVQGADAEVGILDFQANLRENGESITDDVAAILVQWGIRPESVRGSLSGESGDAIALKLIGQMQVWDQQRRMWGLWEQRLYDLARVVLSVESSATLPEGKLLIDWAEIGPKSSPGDKATVYKQNLDMGVVSVPWVQRDMGLTADEIEQIEEENLESGVGRSMPPPMPPPVDPLADPEDDPEDPPFGPAEVQ